MQRSGEDRGLLLFRARSPAYLLNSGTLRDAFKELRHRSILLGGLPVDIEAPFVFCASMSCRAGTNFMAFCLDDLRLAPCEKDHLAQPEP
jgi:hypothetical protein